MERQERQGRMGEGRMGEGEGTEMSGAAQTERGPGAAAGAEGRPAEESKAALREVLLWAYRLILAREPENEQVLIPADDDTPEKIRSRFFGSIEYHNQIRARQTLARIARKAAAEPPPLLLQTADPHAYRELALTAARYNAAWAARHGFDFRLHLGVLLGEWPHHATYNRIVLLDELRRAGVRGWVLYADADNLLLPGCDLKGELAALSAEGVAMVFFDEREAAEGDFSALNAGMMALRLEDPDVAALIAAWLRFYEETYPETFWPGARKWGDVLNDQGSLRALLEIFAARPGFRDKIARRPLHDYVHWFGRGREDPDAGDVAARLAAAGAELYGF